MGCDIHLAVEKRNADGAWERVLPPPEAYDPWLAEQAARETGEERWYRDRVRTTWYDDRNYNLFAILAGVRNDFDFEPISEPRGLPNDLSPDESNDVDLGDHSQSWLTLRELLDCNWDREIKEGGWVGPWDFELWRKEGKPGRWCKGVGGGSVEHISYREMAHKIDAADIVFEGPEPEEGSFDSRAYTTQLGRFLTQSGAQEGTVGAAIASTSYYCYVEWPLTYKEAAGRFYKQIIPELRKLGEPENVRIVFGFDS